LQICTTVPASQRHLNSWHLWALVNHIICNMRYLCLRWMSVSAITTKVCKLIVSWRIKNINQLMVAGQTMLVIQRSDRESEFRVIDTTMKGSRTLHRHSVEAIQVVGQRSSSQWGVATLAGVSGGACPWFPQHYKCHHCWPILLFAAFTLYIPKEPRNFRSEASVHWREEGRRKGTGSHLEALTVHIDGCIDTEEDVITGTAQPRQEATPAWRKDRPPAASSTWPQ
jgi:hypothetical protein